MTDCLIALLYDEPWDCYDTLGLSKRQGNRIMRFSPFNCYRAKEGDVVRGAASEKEWDDILEMIDQDDIQISQQALKCQRPYSKQTISRCIDECLDI